METEEFCTNEDDKPPGRAVAHHQPALMDSVPASTIQMPDFSGRCAASAYAAYATVVGFLPQLTHRFPISTRSDAFRRRFFADVSTGEWNDWRWQIRNRIHSRAQLTRFLFLNEGETTAIECRGGSLFLNITPYYASLLDPLASDQPLRRTVIPTCDEMTVNAGESEDPLGEEADSPVPGLTHRYPDRALFLVNDTCAVHCRYCTRSRLVGCAHTRLGGKEQWLQAIEYIRATPQVRDVLISGGEPLLLSDDKLEWLLRQLRSIRHVEILRIGTKAPVALPQRITLHLTRVLKRFHPLWMSIHFAHPDELTPEVSAACGRLADAGIPLGSQTVLLAGINDTVQTMKDLMHGLMKIRVKPYYLYQCDPILGSAHFRTPVAKGLGIIEGLRGHTTGYAVPTYVIDAPGGGGKIPLLPDYLLGRRGKELLLRNYEQAVFRYPDTVAAHSDNRRESPLAQEPSDGYPEQEPATRYLNR